MSLEYVTFEQIKNKASEIWFDIDEVSPLAKEMIFQHKRGGDVLTPLENGKEWLFEDICKFQPLTGQVLMEGSRLFACCYRPLRPRAGKPPSGLISLLIEVNGRIIEVGRESLKFQGRPSYADDLPASIKGAYYSEGRVNGLIIPDTTSATPSGRLLPIPVSCGWPILEHCMSWLKVYNRTTQEIVDRFELETNEDGNHYGFRVFMVHFSEKDGDFKNSDILVLIGNSGQILRIPNGDISQTSFIHSVDECFDRYCSQMILGKPEPFSFNEYSGGPILKS